MTYSEEYVKERINGTEWINVLKFNTTGARTSCHAVDLRRRVQSEINGLENPFSFQQVTKRGTMRALPFKTY